MPKRTRQIVKLSLENNMKEYHRIKTLQDQLTKQLAESRDNILVDMDELGVDKEGSDTVGMFSIVEEFTRMDVDKAKLKKEYSSVYKLVEKPVTVKRSLRYTKPKAK